MKDTPLNRLCDNCAEDCGDTAENYGWMSGIFQYTTCKNCGQELVSNFSFPHFFWEKTKLPPEIKEHNSKPKPLHTGEQYSTHFKLMEMPKCCAFHISKIWEECQGPENVVQASFFCPDCQRFVGISRCTQEQADEFLRRYVEKE